MTNSRHYNGILAWFVWQVTFIIKLHNPAEWGMWLLACIFSVGFSVVKACVYSVHCSYFMQRHWSICYSFGLVYSHLNKATIIKTCGAEVRGKPLHRINIGKSKYTTALNIRCQTACHPFWNFVVHVKTLSHVLKHCPMHRETFWLFWTMCGHPKPCVIFGTDSTPYMYNGCIRSWHVTQQDVWWAIQIACSWLDRLPVCVIHSLKFIILIINGSHLHMYKHCITMCVCPMGRRCIYKGWIQWRQDARTEGHWIYQYYRDKVLYKGVIECGQVGAECFFRKNQLLISQNWSCTTTKMMITCMYSTMQVSPQVRPRLSTDKYLSGRGRKKKVLEIQLYPNPNKGVITRLDNAIA